MKAFFVQYGYTPGFHAYPQTSGLLVELEQLPGNQILCRLSIRHEIELTSGSIKRKSKKVSCRSQPDLGYAPAKWPFKGRIEVGAQTVHVEVQGRQTLFLALILATHMPSDCLLKRLLEVPLVFSHFTFFPSRDFSEPQTEIFLVQSS